MDGRYPLMLIQFSIENHRSIKDSAVISFAASKDKSLESYLLHPDEKRALLPAIAIYGANAAGKSNVLHALMTMKDMVVGEAAKISKGQKLPWEPFGDTTVPTSFEVVFIYQGVRYAYGFSFDAKKIYTEYLYHWPNGREALIFSEKTAHTNSVRMLMSKSHSVTARRIISCILFPQMTGTCRKRKTPTSGSWKS
ncbi:MAG: AAA family ATPase [Dysosmobacter sp.]